MSVKFKAALMIIFILSVLGVSYTRADFDIPVGAIYIYRVKASNWSAVQGTNTGQGSGLQFQGVSYPLGTQFSIEVDAATSTQIDWTITIGSTSLFSQCNEETIAGIHSYLYLPELLAMGIGVMGPSVALGPFLQMAIFFLEPITARNLFQLLHDQTSSSSLPAKDGWEFEKREAYYDTTSEIVIFDWVCNGKFTNTTENTEFSGDYYVKIAYNENSGLLMGYKLDINYSGKIKGVENELIMHQIIEELNYTIGNYYFHVLPGWEWAIVVPALLFITMITIIRRKQKS